MTMARTVLELMREAAEHGDLEMVATCQAALRGDGGLVKLRNALRDSQ